MTIATPFECPDRGQATPGPFIVKWPTPSVSLGEPPTQYEVVERRRKAIERMAKAMFYLRPRVPGWQWDDEKIPEGIRQHYRDFATAAYDAL